MAVTKKQKTVKSEVNTLKRKVNKISRGIEQKVMFNAARAEGGAAWGLLSGAPLGMSAFTQYDVTDNNTLLPELGDEMYERQGNKIQVQNVSLSISISLDNNHFDVPPRNVIYTSGNEPAVWDPTGTRIQMRFILVKIKDNNVNNTFQLASEAAQDFLVRKSGNNYPSYFINPYNKSKAQYTVLWDHTRILSTQGPGAGSYIIKKTVNFKNGLNVHLNNDEPNKGVVNKNDLMLFVYGDNNNISHAPGIFPEFRVRYTDL